MSDFAFTVVGDASKADKAIESVLAALDHVEADARSAGSAITTAFGAARQAADQAASAAKKAAEANTTFAQRVNRVADELSHEQRMLERIHGPAQRYMADLKALDSLLSANEISTAQYADQISKLNRAIEKTPRLPGGGGGATAPTGGGNVLGGLRTAAATVGIGVGIGEIGGLANEYQNLENRLRYLAGGDMAKVNSLFGQLQGVAQRTRADLSSTTEAFVRISLSTKQMGLSSAETMAFTERLNKAISLSGASGAEASAGMIQLSQGLASGALRGDELRSVLEQLPAVADVIASGLGVTRGQLRSMGEQGKITADVIINSFKKAGSTIDKDFGNTVPTISQSFAMFKNQIVVTIGEIDKATGISTAFGAALSTVGAFVSGAVATVKVLAGAFGELGGAGLIAAGAIASVVAGSPVGMIVAATAAVVKYTDAFQNLSNETVGLIDKFQKWDDMQAKVNLSVLGGAKAMNEAIGEVIQFNLQLAIGAQAAEAFKNALIAKPGAGPMAPVDIAATQTAIDGFEKLISKNKDWFVEQDETAKRARELSVERTNDVTKAIAELAALEQQYAQGGTTLDLYTQKKKQLQAVIDGTGAAHAREKKHHLDLLALIRERIAAEESLARMRGVDSIRNAERGINDDPDALKRALAGTAKKEWEEALELDREYIKAEKEREEQAKKAAEAEQERIKRLTEAWNERLKASQEQTKAFAASFAPIGDALRDAFTQGEVSAKSLDNTLRQVSFNLFRFMALQAAASLAQSGGSGAFAGAIIGGIFGHAHGGQGYVGNGGSGGTDSQIVAFRASPNERVTIETPEDVRTGRYFGGGSGQQTASNFTLMTKNDESEITGAFRGMAGDAVIALKARMFRGKSR